VRGDAFERRLHALEIPEHRIAEDLVAVADVAARRAALLAAGREEIHEIARRWDAQLAQQHLVIDREDRRVDAEPERQRRHDDEGKHRPPREAAQAEPDVAQQIRHLPPNPSIDAPGRPAVTRPSGRPYI
jgi:hypothetical protein